MVLAEPKVLVQLAWGFWRPAIGHTIAIVPITGFRDGCLLALPVALPSGEAPTTALWAHTPPFSLNPALSRPRIRRDCLSPTSIEQEIYANYLKLAFCPLFNASDKFNIQETTTSMTHGIHRHKPPGPEEATANLLTVGAIGAGPPDSIIITRRVGIRDTDSRYCGKFHAPLAYCHGTEHGREFDPGSGRVMAAAYER